MHPMHPSLFPLHFRNSRWNDPAGGDLSSLWFRWMRRGLWIFSFAGVLLVFPFQAAAEQTSKYIDMEGNEVPGPDIHSYFTLNSPGPWKQVADLHFPKIEAHFRKEGLENVRMVDIQVPHPLNDKRLGTITQIFVMDKDHLIVGYQTFDKLSRRASLKLTVNGVINYLEIYVVCSAHGTWKTSLRLPLAKD